LCGAESADARYEGKKKINKKKNDEIEKGLVILW
jgi:hypothetical protein